MLAHCLEELGLATLPLAFQPCKITRSSKVVWQSKGCEEAMAAAWKKITLMLWEPSFLSDVASELVVARDGEEILCPFCFPASDTWIA